MELYENSYRGAIPKKKENVMDRQISASPFVEVSSPTEDSMDYKVNRNLYNKLVLRTIKKVIITIWQYKNKK